MHNIARLKDPKADQAIRSAAEAQILRTDVEGMLLDPRERSVIDVDTHLK
ncbi:hypothetical protein [Streptomyces sp. NBC_00076]